MKCDVRFMILFGWYNRLMAEGASFCWMSGIGVGGKSPRDTHIIDFDFRFIVYKALH